MSGGTLDYVYQKVEEAAEDIPGTTALRRTFKSHLLKIAEALHDIEWVDSSDYIPGQEDEKIRACLPTSDVIEQSAKDAKNALKELRKELRDLMEF